MCSLIVTAKHVTSGTRHKWLTEMSQSLQSRKMTGVAQAQQHSLTFEGTTTDSESSLHSSYVHATLLPPNMFTRPRQDDASQSECVHRVQRPHAGEVKLWLELLMQISWLHSLICIFSRRKARHVTWFKEFDYSTVVVGSEKAFKTLPWYCYRQSFFESVILQKRMYWKLYIVDMPQFALMCNLCHDQYILCNLCHDRHNWDCLIYMSDFHV